MIGQLFDDYLFYRRHTSHYQALQTKIGRLPNTKLDAKKERALAEMLAWCNARGLNPRWWLYSLFARRWWMGAPRWDQLVPRSKATEAKALAGYHAVKPAAIYSDRVTAEIANTQHNFDPNVDVSSTVETTKRRYAALNQSDRCLAEIEETTFGYHPQSAICRACPVANACVNKLRTKFSFDVIAARSRNTPYQVTYHG